MNNKLPNNNVDTRQERREKKLESKRARMRKHGHNLAKIYMDAVMKKLRGQGKDVDKQ